MEDFMKDMLNWRSDLKKASKAVIKTLARKGVNRGYAEMTESELKKFLKENY